MPITSAYTSGYNGTGLNGPYEYYTSTAPSSSLVPAVYPVALDGLPFILDDLLVEQSMWKHESIPLLRPQQDQRPTPGEQSVNPAGYWRRSEEDWKLGTGQKHYDRPESVPERFANSKNVQPFVREWELNLLPLTTNFDPTSYTSADTLTVAGTYLYATHGTVLRRSPDSATPMADWYTFDSSISGLQSDGYWVYVAEGSNLWRFTRDAADPGTEWSTGVLFTELGTVKDRVLAATSNLLYEIDSAGIASVIYTGPNPDWHVIDITEGEGFIWFAGGSGDKYSIYSIDVLDDGTGLAPAQVAGELPEGETITAMEGYLNFILIGVDRGLRLATPTRDGDVTIGSLLSIGSPVGSFEGQGSIVAFEWENFDASSSGIGILDLSKFTNLQGLVPAYASSVMIDGATRVNSITRRSDVMYFLAPGYGIAAVVLNDPTAERVASGFFESGWINWNLVSEEKQLAWIRLDTNGEGDYLIELAVDEGPYQPIAIVDNKHNRVPVEHRGLRFQYRITLLNANGDANPIVYGVALEAYVAVDTTSYITVPLILAEGTRFEGFERFQDVGSTLSHLKSLRETRVLTTYQEGPIKYTVIVEEYLWLPASMIDVGAQRGVYNGTFVATLKVIDRSLGTTVVF